MSGLSVELRQVSCTPKRLGATKVRSSGSQTVKKPGVIVGCCCEGFRRPGPGLSAGHSPGGDAGCPAAARWPRSRNGSTGAGRWTQKMGQAIGWLYLDIERKEADAREGSHARTELCCWSHHAALMATSLRPLTSLLFLQANSPSLLLDGSRLYWV